MMRTVRSTVVIALGSILLMPVACRWEKADPTCGNGYCSYPEDADNCPSDCWPPPCDRDGVCEPEREETSFSCEDCRMLDVCDLSSSGTWHEFVVSAVEVPTDATSAREMGFDLDGDGYRDNALGSLLSLFRYTETDINAEVAQAIEDGKLLQLARIRVDSFDNDEIVVAQLVAGTIHEATPVFGGTDEVALHPDSPTDDYLCGGLVGGVVAGGPGDVTIAFPLPGPEKPVVTLQHAMIRGEVPSAGWHDVVVGGAVSQADVETILLPAVQRMLNYELTYNPDSGLASYVREYMDGSCFTGVCPEIDPATEPDCAADGFVTMLELRCDALVSSVVDGNVEIEGERMLAVGLKIVSAVPVTIVRP